MRFAAIILIGISYHSHLKVKLRESGRVRQRAQMQIDFLTVFVAQDAILLQQQQRNSKKKLFYPMSNICECSFSFREKFGCLLFVLWFSFSFDCQITRLVRLKSLPLATHSLTVCSAVTAADDVIPCANRWRQNNACVNKVNKIWFCHCHCLKRDRFSFLYNLWIELQS